MANVYGDEKLTGARAQWAKMKDAPLKDKIQYILTYYGIFMLLGAIGIWMIVSLISSIIYNSIPNVIAGEFYSYSLTGEAGSDELRLKLCEKMELEEKDYHIDISGMAFASDSAEQAMSQLQKIMARMSAGDLDFLVGTEDFMKGYMQNGSDQDEPDYPFEDLRTILSADLLERLEAEGRVVHYDSAFGDMPFAVDLTASYITRTLDIPDEVQNIACFVVSGKNRDAFAALMELMLEN